MNFPSSGFSETLKFSPMEILICLVQNKIWGFFGGKKIPNYFDCKTDSNVLDCCGRENILSNTQIDMVFWTANTTTPNSKCG